MRGAALAGAAVLAACSPAGAPRETANGTGAAAPAPAPASGAPAATGSGRLRGDVSALSGSVTGFSVQVTDLGTIVALDADVLFDFDQSSLRPDASAALGKAADAIRAGGPGAVSITGYTDAKGDDAYNLDLSERRALSVADWMRAQPGLHDRDLTVLGKGEANPVAPNATTAGADDPAGRARNRRVEIVVPR